MLTKRRETVTTLSSIEHRVSTRQILKDLQGRLVPCMEYHLKQETQMGREEERKKFREERNGKFGRMKERIGR